MQQFMMSLDRFGDSEKSFEETDPLTEDDFNKLSRSTYPRSDRTRWIIGGLVLVVLAQTIALVIIARNSIEHDPTLGLWSPGNDAVTYDLIDLGADEHNSYVATPSDKVDQMWLDLYDFGTIGLTPDEASKLSRPTPPTPKDPDTYPVMIQVFHNIHCLNLMRKAIWREFYPGIIDLHPNGSINDDSPSALHIGHCTNAIREALMCTADVTPLTFHRVSDEDEHVFPDLDAKHMCRNFDLIKNWAASRQVEAWKMDVALPDQEEQTE